MVNEVLLEHIKKSIQNGEYKTVEDLNNYLNYVNKDLRLSSNGEMLPKEEVDKISNSLQEQFKLNKDKDIDFNSKGLNEVNSDNGQLITYINPDNPREDVKAVVSNDGDRDFNDKVKEVYNNADNTTQEEIRNNPGKVVDILKTTGEEVNLNPMVDVNTDKLNSDEKGMLFAAKKVLNSEGQLDNKTTLYDEHKGVVVLPEENQKFVVSKTDSGFQFKQTEDKGIAPETNKQTVIGDDNTIEERDVSEDVFDGVIDNLSDLELDKAEENLRKSNMDRQIMEARLAKIQRVKEARRLKALQEQKTMQLQNQKVLLLRKDNNASRAGFFAITLDMFVLSVMCICILIILFVK